MEIRNGEAYVGVESSQDKKALALEFGNEKGTLKPRPFLNPALEESRREIDKILLDAANKSIESGNKKVEKYINKRAEKIAGAK